MHHAELFEEVSRGFKRFQEVSRGFKRFRDVSRFQQVFPLGADVGKINHFQRRNIRSHGHFLNLKSVTWQHVSRDMSC